jgi:DNA-binding CsgD family transcriptional regulator
VATAQGLYSQHKDEKTGLTKRQTDVLRMINDEGMTQLEVAQALGVSRQRVRQIVEDLLRKGNKVGKARMPGA